jgi:hypothetical protein
MRVRITRKLAEWIDGVDLSHHHIGDVMEVTRHEGELLVAEEWAVQVAPRARMKSRTAAPFTRSNTEDPDRQPFLTAEHVRLSRLYIHRHSLGAQQRRRAEDRFREELRDSRAKIL